MLGLNQSHSDYSGLGGTATDVDNDGLEDLWEFQNLLLTRYNGAQNNDNDVFSNLEEQNSGGDPLCVDEITLSVNDFNSNKEIKVYPNPVTSLLKIENYFEADLRITINDISGKEINIINSSLPNITVDFSSLPKGVYFINFNTESKSSSYKIVKE